MRTPPSDPPAPTGRSAHDKRRRRGNRGGNAQRSGHGGVSTADELSDPRANDKLARRAAAEPTAGPAVDAAPEFDPVAADALEIAFPVSKPTRLLVFANPKAGKGQADDVLGRISPLLRIEHIVLDVHHSSGAEQMSQDARNANLKGVDGVLVLGGDGTVNAVAHGLLSRPASTQPLPPLALLPCGNDNGLAFELGCKDVETGMKRMLAGETRPLDVMALAAGDQRWHAVTIVGWGLAADVAERAERWSLLGKGGYGMAARLETLRSRPRYARLDVALAGRNEEMVQGRYTMLMIANTRHTGHGMLVAPRAVIDDGLIDLVEVLPVGLGKRLKTMSRLRDGSHLDSPAVRWRHVRGVTLSQPSMDELFGESGSDASGSGDPSASGASGAKKRSAEPFRLNIDGDIVELPADAEVAITVLPRALRVFAPRIEAGDKPAKG